MIVACLALTVALSGAGYAAVTLPRNSVGTVQLKKFAVTAKKIKPGNVTRGKITANAVNGAKVADGTLRSADIANGSLTAGDLAPTALDGFFAAVSAASGCSADEGVLTTCASASLTLPRAGKVLLNATSEWHTFALDDGLGANAVGDDTSLVSGTCNLAVDGTTIGLSQPMGEDQPAATASNHPYPEGGTLALTALSGVLPAGVHTVEVACLEDDGDIDWTATNLTAALVDDATPPPTLRVGPAPATQGVPDQASPGKN